MIAVAAAAQGSLTLLIFGPAISIPLVIIGGLSLEIIVGVIGAVIVIAAGTLLAKRKTVGVEAASDRRES